MNENNMNKLALKMARDIMSAKPTMGLSLALSAVHFKMSSLVSQLRLKVDTQAGFGTAVSNFYGLSLSSSGSGKSVGVNLLDGFYFGEAFDFIKRDVFPKFKQRCEAELEVAGIERNYMLGHLRLVMQLYQGYMLMVRLITLLRWEL